MGTPKPPEKALLFVGTLFSDKQYYLKAAEILDELYGPVLFESDIYNWEHTEYYRDELGWPIYRRFIFFNRIIDPSEIVDIKLKTNYIETELSEENKRQINLDPGYITPSKLVLATTKNYAHRIYLSKGIYAEVTLYYRKGKFQAHEFTYKDYQMSEYLELFKKMREKLLNMIK